MPSRWIREEVYETDTGESGYIWTNRKDPRLTVNIHTFLSDDEDEEGNIIEDAITQWYIYPAYDDRGLPNSPDIKDSEKSALLDAARYLRMSNDELLAIGREWPYGRGSSRVHRRPEVSVRRHVRRAR